MARREGADLAEGCQGRGPRDAPVRRRPLLRETVAAMHQEAGKILLDGAAPRTGGSTRRCTRPACRRAGLAAGSVARIVVTLHSSSISSIMML
jgi:hypothetical protein